MTATPASVAPQQGAHLTITSKDGTKIAFEKAGAGPPVIVVNGALSHPGIYREQQKALLDQLSKNFTTILYDRRGRGESSDTKPYAVEREIEDIEVLIASTGGKAYLFGSSSGAALALQATAKLGPERVTKLALYEPPYGQPQQEYDKQKQRVNELIKTGKPGDAAEYFFTAIGTPTEALEGIKSSPEWDAIKTMDFTLAYDYEVLGDGAIPQHAVNAVSVPTLVMNGEKGVPFVQSTVQELGRLIRGAKQETLKGQAHQAEATVLAPVLVEFFSGF